MTDAPDATRKPVDNDAAAQTFANLVQAALQHVTQHQVHVVEQPQPQQPEQ